MVAAAEPEKENLRKMLCSQKARPKAFTDRENVNEQHLT